MAILKPRLSVVENVYHQQPGTGPSETIHRYFRWLESTDQPFARELCIKEDWVPLDIGWIKKIGLIVFRNKEGKFTQLQPTKEEKEDAEKRIIEIRYKGEKGIWLILPNETMKAVPADNSLEVRCRFKEAKCSLVVYPA